MTKRPVTFTYIVFYLLFLPDFWQVLVGILASYFISPKVITREHDLVSQILVYFMLAVIGYAASRPLGKGISGLLRKWILAK
ncbi:MAG: hypothetical protein FP816_15930 [Desulfobacteraceae bacterium]|nr:hypothetical protein [Desulfobacteraceae bacterium]MBU4002229.1 hypothetical protein [Pseudomonadota bacterium]MBU4055083.1 hypothetical protein [Pseudomonadota bacterium]